MWICFWTLYSATWIYKTVFTPAPRCLDYLMISLKWGSTSPPTYSYFQQCFAYFSPFTFLYNSIISLSIYIKTPMGIFRDCIELTDQFEDNWHLTNTEFSEVIIYLFIYSSLFFQPCFVFSVHIILSDLFSNIMYFSMLL